MLTRVRAAGVLAEFLGTAILVTMAIVLSETTAVSYFVATSVAVTLGVVAMIFGGVSGAHFNPAITFGLWTARLVGTVRAISYIAAQMLGGLAAWQLYQYLTHRDLAAKAVTYSTRVWIAELVGTFILTIGLGAALTRAFDALEMALTYGASFFVGIMIAATASAGYLNPAIALGVRSWGTVYILGPLVGALLAANLYGLLFAPTTRVARKK